MMLNSLENYFSKPSHFPNKLEDATGEKTNITYFDTYLSVEDYSRKGTMMITAKIDYFFQDFKSAAKNKFETVIIVNNFGEQVIAFGGEPYPPEEMLMESIEQSASSNGIMNFENQSYYYNVREIEAYPDWTVVGIVPYDKLRIGITTIWNILVGISVLGFFYYCIYGHVCIKQNYRPDITTG